MPPDLNEKYFNVIGYDDQPLFGFTYSLYSTEAKRIISLKPAAEMIQNS